ncbi:reverse transcriptase [Plakobranchus ocellatus]|uniref:Reverse transcriptase n=1 Tax=Plakobranchus ocellatus TaxID=259542 RepID=A0AAV3ZD00_9GAST|nr:reverse transcriptase [Plakobranchus ocellatus]
MIVDEIRVEEDSKRMQKAVQQSQQGHWKSWESSLQRFLPYGIESGTRRHSESASLSELCMTSTLNCKSGAVEDER